MARRPPPDRLRRARAADAAALARLERRAFVGCYAAHRFSAAQFAAYLARPATLAHVVEQSGRIVAYALGVQGGGSRARGARLYSIAVAPTARRRALGRRLLRAFLAAVRRRGCERASLEVAATNRAAIALFTGHGFLPVRRLPAYYSTTTAAIRMRRQLRAAGRRRAPRRRSLPGAITVGRRSRSPCRRPR